MTERDRAPEPWDEAGRRQLLSTPIYRVDEHRRVSPRTGQTHRFYVIDAPDWVNVIPITDEGQVLLVRQYRHGIGELTLEIPGGVIDPEDADPAAAARRELLEETGYRARQIEALGSVAPNPAIQGNRCYSFVATGLEHVGPQQMDGKEDIQVVRLPLDQVLDRIRRGEVNHALVVVAFAWHLLRRPEP